MRDAIVVGGGIAGLAVAWKMRHLDVLLLERDARVGGRIRSERRGPYWLNWGAQFGNLYAETAIRTGFDAAQDIVSEVTSNCG